MAKRQITMLRNPAKRYGCELVEGETGSVDEELADRLLADGIAVLPSSKEVGPAADAKLKAVPDSPSIGGGQSKKADK